MPLAGSWCLFWLTPKVRKIIYILRKGLQIWFLTLQTVRNSKFKRVASLQRVLNSRSLYSFYHVAFYLYFPLSFYVVMGTFWHFLENNPGSSRSHPAICIIMSLYLIFRPLYVGEISAQLTFSSQKYCCILKQFRVVSFSDAFKVVGLWTEKTFYYPIVLYCM